MGAVRLNHITKTYNNKSVVAVDDVSFEVQPGELFGLIGPDGAGKTSIFRMLTTLLLPDTGEATVDGYDIVKDYKMIRSRVGYMPGKFSLYQDLTVEENLRFFATVFDTTIEANYELIKDIYIQIEPFKERRAGKLSGGMKQKLALSCALIHKPTVLFLDEPTTGVDAVSRKEFWDMLKRLKMQGITVLVSTPYMDEATLCDRIALIQSGKILSIDTPRAIVNAYGEQIYALRASNMYRLLNDLRASEYVKSCYAFGEYLHTTLKQDNETTRNELMMQLRSRQHEQLEMKPTEAGIEDCFIKLLVQPV
ncbi:MAG: ABC transporter ATP-binding protein [Bacteroidetes bacterium]|nr:ABC transporter ATP-binding protein [Bacteroidota bacterium]